MELTVENNVVVVSLSVDQDSGYSAAAYARRAEAAEAVTVSAKDQVVSDRDAVSADREAVALARADVEEKAGIAEQAAENAQASANEIKVSGYAKRDLFDQDEEAPFVRTYLNDYASEAEKEIFEIKGSLFYNTTSVFSGWGFAIGAPQNFNGITFRIRARSSGIQLIRCVLRAGDYLGEILAEKTISVNIGENETRDVVCVFDASVENVNQEKLWFSYQCNQFVDFFGRSGSSNPYPIADGYAATRYFTNGTMTGNGLNSSNQYVGWARTGTYLSVVGYKSLLINYLKGKLGLHEFVMPEVDLLFPSVIYTTQGVEMNVFWDNVLFSNYPVQQLSIDVTCTRGMQMERGWRYTPTTSESQATLSVAVYFNGLQIATKSATVISKAATSGPSSIKVLCIGDSTTAGGQYIGIINTDYNVNPVVTFLGTQGSGSNKHEGHSGKTFAWFNGSESPFWDSGIGAINFQKYLSDNGWSLGSNDLISIHLGINDIFSEADPSKLEGIKTNCDSLINELRRVVPGVNIAICVTIPPAISQDAFGDDYNNNQTLDGYLDNYKSWVAFMLENYDTTAMRSNKIFMPQFNCNLDRTYNFPQVEVPANSRTSKTIASWNNGVHPANEGYYQMGDVLWSFIKSLS